MPCVIQRLMIFSLGLTIHFFNPWAMVVLFVELVKEVRKEILTHWMNVGWIWTRMPGDFTLGQHCSLLNYFISHGKKKIYIVFTCHTEQQLSCQPASPKPSPPPPPLTNFLCHFCVILAQNLPFLLVTWQSGSRDPLCPCVLRFCLFKGQLSRMLCLCTISNFLA